MTMQQSQRNDHTFHGSCGYARDMLRQYRLKATVLTVFAQKYPNEILNRLNSQPPAAYSFCTPVSVYQAMLEKQSGMITQFNNPVLYRDLNTTAL